ncbi:MAG: hypothetical protein MUF71_18585 [Candidatus Kapabacteria bacterium]|jgi:hypothetical protein|nr:hypothetical protein [Candidatus Kapabacteria bacterium]
MRPNVLLIVEGIEDAVFLQACIYAWFQTETAKISIFSEELDSAKINSAFDSFGAIIFNLKSQDKLKQFLKLENGIAKRKLTKHPDLKILVVVDADKPHPTDTRNPHHGGIHAKRAHILDIARETVMPIGKEQIFLFPDNASDGTLEDLLQSCIPDEHSTILECWANYAECVVEKGYTPPSNKTKIFSYAEIQTKYNEAFGEKRDYLKPEHWNLDSTSKALAPLYDFLKPHFSKETTP